MCTIRGGGKDHSPIVHVRHFCRWRADGIAFDIRDAPYDVPNRTLASGRVFQEKRGGVEKRGYWGDIVNSPYIGLGVECEEVSFFKLRQDKFMKSAVDVAVHNVSAHVHEALTGTPYKLVDPDSDGSAATVDAPPEAESKITEVDEEAPETEAAAAAAVPTPAPEDDAEAVAAAVAPDGDMTVPLPGVRITMLPKKFPQDMLAKKKYRNLFDVVYYGAGMVHHLKEDGVSVAFKPSATIVAEGVEYYLGLTNEQKTEFATKVSGYAAACGASPISPIDGTKQAHYFYRMPPSDTGT
jgi:dynein assembly factor 3